MSLLMRRQLCSSTASRGMPVVAIVGAPNAGKSTLFNRLSDRGPGLVAFRPRALISPMAGTTRDRLETSASWNEYSFRLVDTGGVHNLDETLVAAAAGRGRLEVEQLVESQVLTAVRGASVVLFVVDALAGVTQSDERLAPTMRRLATGEHAPSVLLAVNKVDHPGVAESCGYFADFWALGLGEPLALSAYHGTGIDTLLEAVVAGLPPPPMDEEPDAHGTAARARASSRAAGQHVSEANLSEALASKGGVGALELTAPPGAEEAADTGSADDALGARGAASEAATEADSGEYYYEELEAEMDDEIAAGEIASGPGERPPHASISASSWASPGEEGEERGAFFDTPSPTISRLISPLISH